MTHTQLVRPLTFVGAGSLGQSFAALIARSGHAVTLLASPRTDAALRTTGAIHLRGVVAATVPTAPAPAPPGVVGVTADPHALPPGGGVIFVTKGHDLEAVIASVRDAWSGRNDDTAWVAGVQNGVVKDDLLAAAFGANRVVGAATILGAQRLDDGAIRVTSLGMTYFGEFAGTQSGRVQEVLALFRAGNIPAEIPADIRSVLWSKACNATGVFGVSMLSGPETPPLFANPHLMRAYLTLVRETAAVARAEGVSVGNYANFPPIATYAEQPVAETIAALPPLPPLPPPGSTTPRSQPSMVQDYVAGRPMEVEAIFGDIVARAERYGVPVPSLVFVRDMLRGLNGGGSRQ